MNSVLEVVSAEVIKSSGVLSEASVMHGSGRGDSL